MQGDIGLEFHISKVPIKYQSFPLTLILDLYLHTPLKLNIHRGGASLLDPTADLPLPEWHQIRFEGMVCSKFTNTVDDIVKMRNMFKKQAKIIEEGE
jgi:hypothetical protein